jgi:hypothetical protein
MPPDGSKVKQIFDVFKLVFFREPVPSNVCFPGTNPTTAIRKTNAFFLKSSRRLLGTLALYVAVNFEVVGLTPEWQSKAKSIIAFFQQKRM